jgi:hypothetical protein
VEAYLAWLSSFPLHDNAGVGSTLHGLYQKDGGRLRRHPDRCRFDPQGLLAYLRNRWEHHIQDTDKACSAFLNGIVISWCDTSEAIQKQANRSLFFMSISENNISAIFSVTYIYH